ncbi:MAG TPA: DegT/DnrJ/EryC1/StrS family aminotransferase [Bacteroidetes bacterium]|nr:DegT/DnrJ/EryC1/StrS family aminotransferase [Bacteroidota bacterium]
MRTIQMVDLYHQYLTIKDDIDTAMQSVISSCAFINGPDVKLFSSELEQYLGTDALQIALMSLNLEPGDEVITTPFTFIATAEVIELLRLKPVFVDVDPETYLMDVDQVKNKITKKSRVILPVHLFGQSVNMQDLLQIAVDNNLKIVEDNAQAIGAECHVGGLDRKTGTIGDIGCTSFFPSKNLGCFGDGGAIFTNKDDLADKIRMIINHGSKKKHYHEQVGVNSRLDTLQAAVLRLKLKKLDEYIHKRQLAASHYDFHLGKIKQIKIPKRLTWSSHVFHQYTLIIDKNRNEFRAHLNDKNIPNMIYYPIPLHLQKAYEHLGHKIGDFPNSEYLSQKVLSLPMHTELDDEQLSFITNSIKDFFE